MFRPGVRSRWKSERPPEQRRSGAYRLNGLSQLHLPFRVVDVQVFNEPSIHHDNTLAFGNGSFVGCDNLLSLGKRILVRRKGPVGGIDLLGVDERLAIKAEVTTLLAGRDIAIFIGEIEMDAIQERRGRRRGRPGDKGRAR